MHVPWTQKRRTTPAPPYFSGIAAAVFALTCLMSQSLATPCDGQSGPLGYYIQLLLERDFRSLPEVALKLPSIEAQDTTKDVLSVGKTIDIPYKVRGKLGRIAKITVEEMLGQGSFGKAYRATAWLEDGTPIAIALKEIPYDPKMSRDPFVGESMGARWQYIATQSGAKHLVPIHGRILFKKANGKPLSQVHLMNLVGPNLNQFINEISSSLNLDDLRSGASHKAEIPPEEAIRAIAYILRDISAGTAELAQQGLVHGDLKPGNIAMLKGKTIIDILMGKATWGLLDFGLTRRHNHIPRNPKKGGAPFAPGTIGYMAPEIRSETLSRGDLKSYYPAEAYALGKVACRLLGIKIFEGDARYPSPRPNAAVLADLMSVYEAMLRGKYLSQQTSLVFDDILSSISKVLTDPASRVRNLSDLKSSPIFSFDSNGRLRGPVADWPFPLDPNLAASVFPERQSTNSIDVEGPTMPQPVYKEPEPTVRRATPTPRATSLAAPEATILEPGRHEKTSGK